MGSFRNASSRLRHRLIVPLPCVTSFKDTTKRRRCSWCYFGFDFLPMFMEDWAHWWGVNFQGAVEQNAVASFDRRMAKKWQLPKKKKKKKKKKGAPQKKKKKKKKKS